MQFTHQRQRRSAPASPMPCRCRRAPTARALAKPAGVSPHRHQQPYAANVSFLVRVPRPAAEFENSNLTAGQCDTLFYPYRAHFDREPLPPARHTFGLVTEGCQHLLVTLVCDRPCQACCGLGKDRVPELLLTYSAN